MTSEEFTNATRVIWDYLCVRDKPTPADAIFAFGGPSLAVPEHAAKLFHDGFAPRILVTGDVGTFDDSGRDQPAAFVYADHLVPLNVPSDRIIIVPQPKHTLAEVLIGIPQLLQQIPELSTIIAVTIPLHQRRVMATLRKAFPSFEYISSPCAEAPPEDGDMRRCQALATRGLQELYRLRVYALQENLLPQEVPAAVLEAENLLLQLNPHL